MVVFVAIGRATHEDAASLTGYLGTVWPFLVALGAGWVLGRVWRRPEVLVPSGVVVWVTTLVGGMGLRALAGDGTALPFVIVATGFLALTLLGWRAGVRVAGTRKGLSRQG